MPGTSIQYDLNGNPVEGFGLETLFDYTGGPGDAPVYIGYAQPVPGGVPTDEAVWKIVRFTYSGDNVTAKHYATGSTAFKHVWDDRADASNWP